MRLQSASFILGAALLTLMAPAGAQSIPANNLSTGTQTSSTGTTGTGTQTTSTATGTGTVAGTGTGTGSSTGTQTSATGAFSKLSPGGQKIAQSLYSSQNPPTGTKALTLDQIATMKSHEGWGRVFKDMKADGLVQAKNLGQVVSGHAKTTQTTNATGTTSSTGSTSSTNSTQTTSSTRSGSRQVSSQRTSSRSPVVVTSGSGRSTVFASNAGRGGMGRGGGGRFASASPIHFTTTDGSSGGGGGHGGGGGRGK